MKVGYAKPRATRGLHPSGLRVVIVWRPKDLENLDPKVHAGMIAHTVGENKRVQILDEAKKVNIRILNPGPKKPAEAGPEVAAKPTPAEPAEPTPETKKTAEEDQAKPSEQEPKQKKAKPKTSKKRKAEEG